MPVLRSWRQRSSAHTWFDAGRAPFPAGQAIDIRLGDGSVLCDCLLQFDGDIWWAGAGAGEKFIDPACTPVTHWRAHAESGPAHEPEVSLEAAGADADGHAFRLLVQQRMSLAFRAADEGMVASINGRSVEVPLGDDAYAATRRAVALADDPRRARA